MTSRRDTANACLLPSSAVGQGRIDGGFGFPNRATVFFSSLKQPRARLPQSRRALRLCNLTRYTRPADGLIPFTEFGRRIIRGQSLTQRKPGPMIRFISSLAIASLGAVSALAGTGELAGHRYLHRSAVIVVAQGGTVGGTIGKQRKSVSGGEEAAEPRRTAPPSRRKTAPATGSRTSRQPAASRCGRAAGTWAWFNGRTVTIGAGGTASSGSLTASWSCIGGQLVIMWSHGYTDRLTLSPDGNRLSGTNGIIAVSGKRK